MERILFFVFLIIAGLIAWFFTRKKTLSSTDHSTDHRSILLQYVDFYKELSKAEKIRFEQNVSQFLNTVTITGVGIDVELTDKILIAAGAVIPIFNFKNWEYTNLNEVLLYPDAFSLDFEQAGKDRNIAGMVGTGAMHRTMILSQPTLRAGFTNKNSKHNTAIHEFVHLIDKTDGETDGIPDALIPHAYALPWLKLIHKKIAEIQKGKSDIDAYGTLSEAEFFAVVAEYFFTNPAALKDKHPELYSYLCMIFEPSLSQPK